MVSGKKATRDYFLNNHKGCDVLHFATHAYTNDIDPMNSKLIFSGSGGRNADSLFAFELYNINLDAKLAILDGCSTGDGRLRESEGLMSLARAFTYAGCDGLLVTLWEETDNKSTPVIMRSFFDRLSEGLPRDVALQKAKLSFLESTDISNFAHPNLWAELAVIGDCSPVIPVRRTWLGKNYYWLVIGGSSTLLLFGFFVIRRLRKQKNFSSSN
jgi:CHAT domain-containing protein